MQAFRYRKHPVPGEGFSRIQKQLKVSFQSIHHSRLDLWGSAWICITHDKTRFPEYLRDSLYNNGRDRFQPIPAGCVPWAFSYQVHNNQNLRNNVFSRIDINKIEIPQETLNMFDNPNTCRICFANTVNKSNPAQISCGHFFCDNCIQMHMTTKIVNGRVLDIRCLMGGCPKKYTDDEISANVNDVVFHKYKRFKNEQLKLNNPNKKYVPCPFPDCDELVEIENPDEEFVECGQRHVFCYKCHRLGTHKKGKCQRENIVLLNQIQKGNKNGINFKQCPKCKVIIE